MKKKTLFILLAVLLALALAAAGWYFFLRPQAAPAASAYQLRQRGESMEYGPVGLGSLSSLSQIPLLNSNLYFHGDSSYSRENTNDDGFSASNFLYVDDEGRYVVCDVKGRGVVTRIWMLGNSVDGNDSHIQIYVDGAAEPLVDMSYNEFIAGRLPPFNNVVCTRSGQGGVHVCYLSMPFEKSMYIAMTRPNGFWQVDYSLAEEDTLALPSMTGQEDWAAETMLMKRTGSPLAGYTETREVSVTAKAGKTAKVFSLDGPRQIAFLEVDLDGLTLPQDTSVRDNANLRALLNDLRLRIFWDGEAAPSVDAPFALLFGIGSFGYNHEVKSLMYGVKDERTLYLYFPMPFEKHADVQIVNGGGKDVALTVRAGLSAGPKDYYNVGYFTTAYNNYYVYCQDPFEAVMLDVKGSGKVVSIQENIFGQVGQVWFEEGDNRFYIDGSVTPQVIGTGTEDFYNGAGYFIKDSDTYAKLGFHTLPFSGYTNYFALYDRETTILSEGVSCYRTFVTDPIAFRSGIRLTFEHGGGTFSRTAGRNWNTNQTAGYEVLVCYYYQPVVKMQLADTLLAGDGQARAAHNWQGDGEAYAVASSYFGSFFMMTEEKTFLKNTGSVSFEMALGGDQHGAVLYRVYDQNELNLGASVFVDGQYAGEWYKAGRNVEFRFADDYFVIPEKYTRGKERITVTLQPNTASAWNAAEYRLYALSDALIQPESLASGKVYTVTAGKQAIDAVDSEFEIGSSYTENPVRMANVSGAVEQDYRLIRYTDGSWFIISQGSGTLLSQNGADVVRKMYPNKQLSAQELWLLEGENGAYRIRNRQSGQYMTVKNGKLTMTDQGTVFKFTELTARKLCAF